MFIFLFPINNEGILDIMKLNEYLGEEFLFDGEKSSEYFETEKDALEALEEFKRLLRLEGNSEEEIKEFTNLMVLSTEEELDAMIEAEES